MVVFDNLHSVDPKTCFGVMIAKNLLECFALEVLLLHERF